MGWLPIESAEVVYVPLPCPSVAVPSVEPPSLKVTVPVAEDGITVAVKVTGCPTAAGFVSDRSTVAVAAFVTVWVRVADVLALSLAFPAYAALREWLPTPSELSVRLPLPWPIVAVPSVVVPSLKVRVPVALLGVIVAVSVMPEPNVAGLRFETRAVAVFALLTVCVRVFEVLAR
jgi:hypothetical protein